MAITKRGITNNNSAENGSFSPERITDLTVQLSSKMDNAIKEIGAITFQSRILSLNAKVEASRAGAAGAAFSVVASEMGRLSEGIETLVTKLEKDTSGDFKEIAKINDNIAINFRGTRLSDLALNAIDLIDRNLYERSCDIRWWATDSSVVNALMEKTQEAHDFASERLGVILDSYTVYFDIILCDINALVVANGRKNQYRSIGQNVSDSKWFRVAMDCATATDYGWETVHRSPLVNNELALIYTTAVREDGNKRGRILGALGALFRYEALAQTIVENVPLSKEEKGRSRVCIVDDDGLVLADTERKNLETTIDFLKKKELFAQKKGFVIDKYKGQDACIAHALAPGYETYTTGWHALIIQRL